jgi:branched-chain amino acid transport system permease protein
MMMAATGVAGTSTRRFSTNLVVASVTVITIFVLLIMPRFLDNYFMRLATTVFMYCVLAWSWNFIGGFVGYPSFGIAAFFGLGAYVGAVLLLHKMVPFWLSAVCAGIACLIVAAVIGAPILRLRGQYFAVASLVVGEVFREIAMSWTDLTGGGMGINLPPMRPTFGTEPQIFYYSMLALALATLVTTVLVSRSRLGIAFRCIRQNEEAAKMIGIDATRTKIIAFALSAAFPGAAGAIYASWVSYIDPSDVFDILNSVKAPVMVLLGGIGTVMGPAIGALVYLVFEEIVWRSLLQFHAGMLGAIIVGLVLFLPNGFVDVLRRRRHSKGGR